jgi:hypothetical protein
MVIFIKLNNFGFRRAAPRPGGGARRRILISEANFGAPGAMR